MASSGMEYIWFLVSTFQLLSSSSPTFTSMTRKFVPPRSRARKSPTSVKIHTISECTYLLYLVCEIYMILAKKRSSYDWRMSIYLIPQGWSRHTLEAFWHWPLHASLNAVPSPSHVASSSWLLLGLPYSAWTLTGSALPATRGEKSRSGAAHGPIKYTFF